MGDQGHDDGRTGLVAAAERLCVPVRAVEMPESDRGGRFNASKRSEGYSDAF